MKKSIIILLVTLVCNGLYSQDRLKSNVFLGIGRPTHPDMDFNENRLLLSLNYRTTSVSY